MTALALRPVRRSECVSWPLLFESTDPVEVELALELCGRCPRSDCIGSNPLADRFTGTIGGVFYVAGKPQSGFGLTGRRA